MEDVGGAQDGTRGLKNLRTLSRRAPRGFENSPKGHTNVSKTANETERGAQSEKEKLRSLLLGLQRDPQGPPGSVQDGSRGRPEGGQTGQDGSKKR